MGITKYVYSPEQYSIQCSKCDYIQDLGDKYSEERLEAQGWREVEDEQTCEYWVICPRCAGKGKNPSDEDYSESPKVGILLNTVQGLHQALSKLHPDYNDPKHDDDHCQYCQVIGGAKGLLTIEGIMA